jgi:SAM-dependent methyltransferase
MSGIIGGLSAYRLLRRICPDGETGWYDRSAYRDRSKLEVLFGPQIWEALRGKDVIDFGCGGGTEAVELAQRGARSVIGIDIWEAALSRASLAAEQAGVAGRCSFVTETSAKADVILSLDAFEHFADPAQILRTMRRLIRDDGRVMIAFGPPWYHPLGGHLFSVFPWAHLIFTESALIRWRSDFKTDGATCFPEVEGGLNQMTIRRFESVVAESDFGVEHLDLVPIRRVRMFANRITREFTTSMVRCSLTPRP